MANITIFEFGTLTDAEATASWTDLDNAKESDNTYASCSFLTTPEFCEASATNKSVESGLTLKSSSIITKVELGLEIYTDWVIGSLGASAAFDLGSTLSEFYITDANSASIPEDWYWSDITEDATVAPDTWTKTDIDNLTLWIRLIGAIYIKLDPEGTVYLDSIALRVTWEEGNTLMPLAWQSF